LRPYQLATAAVIILIAAVAMFDTRAGALPDPTGGAPGGLRGGWYPFWSAALMAVTAAIVLYQSATLPQPAQGLFTERRGVIDVLRLVLPLIVLVVLMDPALGRLGFYISGALYCGYFALIIGRYHPVWAAVLTVTIPAVIFLMFELGFKASLPKSFLFEMGFPF
jgi:hypothetical protein